MKDLPDTLRQRLFIGFMEKKLISSTLKRLCQVFIAFYKPRVEKDQDEY
jgi:hypothetical protein